jgi:hypothetical protein
MAVSAVPGGSYFQIVERSAVLVESAINYNNLPILIEAKFST